MPSSACFSCCFRSNSSSISSASSTAENQSAPSILRSSSTWLRSRAHELPELRDKFGTLISRFGKSQRSKDFTYDPLSYALNFDDGFSDGDGEVVAGEEVNGVAFG